MSWYSGLVGGGLLGLVVQLAGALAWPVAIVLICRLFRQELRLALGRVARLRFRDFEAEFRQELRNSEALVNPMIRDVSREERARTTRLELAGSPTTPPGRVSPQSRRCSIEESWTRVTNAAILLTAAARARGSNAAATEELGSIRAMSRIAEVTPSDLLLFEKLRTLRERLIDEPEWEPSQVSTDRYESLAEGLTRRFERRRTDEPAAARSIDARADDGAEENDPDREVV